MNENCQIDPYSGDSCIECKVTTLWNNWGGWLFINGYLPQRQQSHSQQLASGALPAATVEALDTGFSLFTGDPWRYGDNLHIAPVAWYVMAVNDFNPYEVR
jgi:hypothetical protein